MKNNLGAILAIAVSLVLSSVILARGPERAQDLDNVERIFRLNCSTAGCHSGKTPPAGLNLEPELLPGSVVGVASREKPGWFVVDPAAPEKSYLLAKIKGEPGIVGVRMPAKRDPLTEAEIKQIEDWIKSLGAAS